MNSKLISVNVRKKKEVYNKQLGVIFNGEDNLYDVLVESLIDNSPTASQCANIYDTFLGGAGFEVEFETPKGSNLLDIQTPNDLLSCITPETKYHQAVFIHVSYNAAFEKTDFKVVPYSYCRVGKKDDDNYSGKVVVNTDGWDKRADKKKIKVYDTYNPRPEVILAQVERDGGWDKYKGQILYFKLNDHNTYAESKIESCYLHCDSESALGLHYNRTITKGFKDAWIVRHEKFDNEKKQRGFQDNLKMLYGNESTGGIMLVEDEFDSDSKEPSKFKFDFLEDKTDSKKYAHFEESLSNYIRKAWNIPPQLVDFIQGKLGNTSGEDLKTAEAIYNKTVSKDRKRLELMFTELYRNYYQNINPSGNWTIGLYSLMDDGTIQTQ